MNPIISHHKIILVSLIKQFKIKLFLRLKLLINQSSVKSHKGKNKLEWRKMKGIARIAAKNI